MARARGRPRGGRCFREPWRPLTTTSGHNLVVRYRFEGSVLDTTRYELSCGGELVHVEPQVFDVLAHLVEHRDRVVPKAELLEVVWGHQFVSESALTTRIKQLRQAVGDSGRDQRVVQTVHGRGYRFVAPVEELPDVTERVTLPVPGRTAPGDPLLHDVRRHAARLRHRRLRSAAGAGRSLDHPPRLRLAEPGVAPLARRAGPPAHVRALRRARLRPLRP